MRETQGVSEGQLELEAPAKGGIQKAAKRDFGRQAQIGLFLVGLGQ